MALKSIRNSSEGLIAPSILSADFSRLAEEVADVDAGGADWIHVDVMDGHFVPNLTIGPLVVNALRPQTELPLDCHLMISNPEDFVDAFARVGANAITVHVEATDHLDRLLNRIKDLGCKAGVSLNPATPVSAIENVLDIADIVLVMSVNPGFGGQKFIDYSLEKVRRLVELRGDRSYMIEIDGGVTAANAGEIRKAGVDVFVAGSAVFGNKDRAAAIQGIRDQF